MTAGDRFDRLAAFSSISNRHLISARSLVSDEEMRGAAWCTDADGDADRVNIDGSGLAHHLGFDII